MNDLPASLEHRKILKAKIESAATLKLEQKILGQDIKAIADSVKDELGIEVKEFNARVKVRATQKWDEAKYTEEKETADVIFAQHEQLFGGE